MEKVVNIIKTLVVGNFYVYRFAQGFQYKTSLFYLLNDQEFKPDGNSYYKFFDMIKGNIILVSHFYRTRLSEFKFEDMKEID